MTITQTTPSSDQDTSVASSPARGLTVSHLSPLTRAEVLPPHHPARAAGGSAAYPYAQWSAGAQVALAAKAPAVVSFRGRHLTATVDLSKGGRILGLVGTAGHAYVADVRLVADGEDARGAGMHGGIELNPSSMQRSPWALEPMTAAAGIPTRLGGDRIRWWELERASGFLCQVDLHLPDAAPVLLVVSRQVRFLETAAPLPPPVSVLVDDATRPTLSEHGSSTWNAGDQQLTVVADGVPFKHHRGHAIRLTPSSDDVQTVSWFALALGEVDLADVEALLPAALDGLEDPVTELCGRTVSEGTGWAAAELERLRSEGRPLPVVSPATPLQPLGDVQEVAHRRRSSPGHQWLHLLRGEGLGVMDRVHPGDVGQPAGKHWRHQLTRAHHQEALGDWRVHLRLGELAFLEGNLAEAYERWSWSHSLRPTPWADRNLALLELVSGRPDQAAVRYLRAQRVKPDDVELAIEAIGCLIAANRPEDGRGVLDRMVTNGLAVTARYWLLEAEVAIATRNDTAAALALSAAGACADIDTHRLWAERLTAPKV
jgi:hypothetical protein